MKPRVFLGIDIGGTNIELAVVGIRGRLLAQDTVETRPNDGPVNAFARIGERVSSLVGGSRDVEAAGVGCAGLVDFGRGKLLSSPNLPTWRNTALSRIARRHLGVYTVVDNDANAAAFGEYKRGVGRGARSFVCITLGTGVGGSIILDGRVLRGRKNYAGEIGHMTISERGPLCKCGNRGCLEAYVGADALVRSAMKKLRRGSGSLLWRWIRDQKRAASPRLIAEAAKKRDAAARAVFDEAGAHLGTAMASLINVFNPDVIAVAGRVAAAFSLMERSMWDTIHERAFAEAVGVVAIQRGGLGKSAAAIGAALLARQAVRERADDPRGG
ncbi:MAG: ROK family protein [Candidatus Latescibacterota bacterium]|nr:MAG: ROK family protein [Candidatus Latescibacterota bacterium]